jgi:aryl-alcohol dehydrogenase-like predicted oxidoreductase
MGLSVYYGPPPPDAQRFAVLDYVFQSGCTFWDTSDIYGDSEDLIGKWLARTGVRNELFLATKFAATEEFAKDDGGQCIKDACDRSLKRLGVDMIDLYYLHRIERYMPIETAIEALVELQEEGKIRYLGLSECTAEGLRAA